MNLLYIKMFAGTKSNNSSLEKHPSALNFASYIGSHKPLLVGAQVGVSLGRHPDGLDEQIRAGKEKWEKNMCFICQRLRFGRAEA